MKLLIIIFSLFCFLDFAPGALAETIFFDNFNSGSYDKWTIARNSGNCQWYVENVASDNNVLKAKYYQPGVSEMVPKDLNWQSTWNNYSLETDMTFVSGVDKNLAFRYSDSLNWYGVHFSGGIVSLQKVLNGNPPNGIQPSPFPIEVYRNFSNGLTYHVKIVVLNNNIKFYVDNELIIEYTDNNSPLLTGKPALQASAGGNPTSEVWFDNVVVTGIDATPMPTPTITPTAAPSPSTSPSPTLSPVRKVVVIPGLGSTWNADALLNCKSEDYIGEWTLAPYAADFYNPLISALGDQAKPFYYDWRKDVNDQKDKLKNFIDSLGDEKVNLIGHSLGGLVGRAYLEQMSNSSKLEKLLTAGSPHQGSPIAYPAWAAGDLWHDDLKTKIGITLLLKRCTGLNGNDREMVQEVVPSLNNLLPTFPYLRDKKTDILKPIDSMYPEFKNKWLSSSTFPPASSNVVIRTLSGTGFRTIENINVNDPSSHDIKLGNWLKGRPAGKEWTNEGDGMALLKSTMLEGLGSENHVINQTHGGLITSLEGINEILNFFNLNPATNIASNNNEAKSALIIIGYPASFWVRDQNGIIKDREGMVALMNPKTYKFQFGLLPKNNQTLFIVAQFLEDGRTFWKEYNFKNFLPKFGNINYNQTNPDEDPLL